MITFVYINTDVLVAYYVTYIVITYNVVTYIVENT